MSTKKINLINTSVDFIEKNNLGLTDFFSTEEKQYTDIEKKRLEYLLDICNNLINEKISLTNLKPIIKDKLQISENLSIEIVEKIKAVLSEKELDSKEIDDGENIANSTNQDINKKSIFSTIIKEK
ncbi:MAG: hypothetical protein WC511_05705 [Candidatus Pacearchaeota archaeon]